jgi:hypothetical protein
MKRKRNGETWKKSGAAISLSLRLSVPLSVPLCVSVTLWLIQL